MTAAARTAGARRPRLSLATLTLVLFLTFLDNTVVSVALADIQTRLSAGVAALQWVVDGYALPFAALMLAFGALSDRFGRKRVMLLGVAVFCAGSVIGAVAPDSSTLIAGRVVMGVGAAASEPGTLSMIRHLYSDRAERARALGVWAAVSGLALALGPVIGGVLVGLWSFRAIFWFNVAFGVLAFAGALTVLPESADPDGRAIDWLGFLLGATAISASSGAVIWGETAGYGAAHINALFAVAAVAAVGFVWQELRSPNPMLDLRFFKRGAFAGSTFVAFAVYFGIFSIFFFVALYLQIVGNATGYATAVLFLPMAGGMVVSSVFAGRWVAESGPRMPMVFGCFLAALGIILTDVRITPSAGMASIGWTLALAGVGLGVAVVPVTSTALSVIPPEHSGTAASATNTSRELGAVVGVAALGSMVNAQLTTQLSHQLAAIGIPPAFRAQVITAVTTGQFNSQAASVTKGNKALQAIVDKIINAAYGAFGHGIDLALLTAGALLAFCAVVAALTIRVRPSPSMGPGFDEPAAAV
ncbi:MAG TPA: MFS transporter [Acidimicrobiales bacterium]|nr:MFS transporter [Acidimicrobiales bacterium]